MIRCKINNFSKLKKNNLIENLIKRYGSKSSDAFYDQVLNKQKQNLLQHKFHKTSWNTTHNQNRVSEATANHQPVIEDKLLSSNKIGVTTYLKIVTSGKNIVPSVCLEVTIINLTTMKVIDKKAFHFNSSSHLKRVTPFYLSRDLQEPDCVFLTRLNWDSVVSSYNHFTPHYVKLDRPLNIFGPTGFRNYWNSLSQFLYSSVVNRDIIKPKYFVYEMCESMTSFDDRQTKLKFNMINLKPSYSEDLRKKEDLTLINNVICYIVELPGDIITNKEDVTVDDDDTTIEEPSLNIEENHTDKNSDILISQFSSVKEFINQVKHKKEEGRNRINSEQESDIQIKLAPKTNKNNIEAKADLLDIKQNISDPMFVIILECPSVDYIPSLDNAFGFSFSSAATYTVVHMTELHVLSTSAYQKWMTKFHKSCNHVFVNEDTNKSNENLMRHQVNRNLCNLIDPQFFPIYSAGHSILLLRNFDKQSLNQNWKNYRLNSNMLIPINHNHNKILKMKKLLHRRLAILNEYEEIYNKVEDVKVSCSIHDNGYPRVVVLGMGGASSGIKANPCFLVMLDEQTSMMLDCGATSCTQLYDHFGPHFTPQILSTIKAIILTHRHSDHFCGIYTMLQEIKKHNPHADTRVVIPHHRSYYFLMDFLDKYDSALKGNFKFLKFTQYTKYEVYLDLKKHLNLNALFFPVVSHGVFTIGVVFEFGKYKLVYSSDTLPMSSDLIDKGRGADLLIHDCLFVSDDSVIEACFKNHSTFKGAINTANAMQAKNLLTTHFSESYQFIPMETLDHPTEKLQGTHMYALDHLELPLNDTKLSELSQHHDKLKALFPLIGYDQNRREEKRGTRTLHKKEKYLKSFEQNLARNKI